ncbi:MAG: hypothetical protein ACYCUG_00145 [Acidimicrobiales bacterium]
MTDARDGQDRPWGGEQGRWWADNHARTEAMLSLFTPHLLAAAAVASSEAVLDVGCGCGATSLQEPPPRDQAW